MSEKFNRIRRADIESMSTADLEAFLQMDMQLPDDKQSDAETIIMIMEVLDSRGEFPDGTPKTSEEAFDEFQRLYLPAVEELQKLHEDAPKTIRFPAWVRTVAAAVAVIVVLLSGSMTVKAMGFDLWGFVAKWTNDIFSFVDPNVGETSTQLAVYDEIQSVLDSYNVEVQLVPHWLPEGYMLKEVYSSETPKSIDVAAQFTRGKSSVFLSFTYHRDGCDPYLSEKDKQTMTEYLYAGKTHYLLWNNGNVVAKWVLDRWECSIYGQITIDEMKQIIASIYEGE